MSKYDFPTQFEYRKTKSEKRKTKNEKRKTKNEKRKAKNEKRKAKNEKRKTKIKPTSPCSYYNKMFVCVSSLRIQLMTSWQLSTNRVMALGNYDTLI